MKWIPLCSALVATLGLTTAAQADAIQLVGGKQAEADGKACCGPAPQVYCKPVIARPQHRSVHTYQRKCSDIKPPACAAPCAPKGCAPCGPAGPKCAAPAPTAPKCAAPAPKVPKCAAPAPKCAAPGPKCAAPGGCGLDQCGQCGYGTPQPPSLLDRLFGAKKGVCTVEMEVCCADPCEIAKLIYRSQTACYADDREDAIHELGDNYDCRCNPEIMSAFVYALNDADEDVRAKAADEIGDQLRDNPCCCTQEVVSALICALSDCDRDVRRQAEEALKACGYEIVDGYCMPACGGCGACGACNAGGAPTPAPMPEEGGKDKAAPAPPEDPKAYFPSRLRNKQTAKRSRSVSPLANLFGLLD